LLRGGNREIRLTAAHAPKQVLVGGAWLIAARAIDRVVGVVSISVMARLLKPSDFGVVALAGTVVGAVELLSAFSFDWALVRHRNPSVDDLNSAWTLRVLLGVATCIGIAALGPAGARFYHQPALRTVLIAMGAISFTGSLENIGTVYFRRDFAFHMEFLIRSAAKVGGFCVSITAALLLRSYWALVAGLFAVRVISVSASYLLHPFRPRLSLKNARDLLGFSSSLLFVNVIDYCRVRFADLYIGRAYGAATNGLFAVAGEISIAPLTEVSQPIMRAAYSRYAEDVRANRGLTASYVSITSLIWMISLPMAAGTAAVAPAIIGLLLGPKWQAAVPVLRWSAIGVAIAVMSTGTQFVCLALGRSRVAAASSAVGAAILIPAAILCSHLLGYVGVALAFAVTSALMVPVNFALLRRVAGIRFAELWGHVWRVVLGTLLMGGTLWYLFRGSEITGSASALRVLLEQVAVGVLTYTVVVYTAWIACGRPPGPEHLVEQVIRRVLGRWSSRYAA
jgi:lipopolysaccharide exporter